MAAASLNTTFLSLVCDYNHCYANCGQNMSAFLATDLALIVLYGVSIFCMIIHFLGKYDNLFLRRTQGSEVVTGTTVQTQGSGDGRSRKKWSPFDWACLTFIISSSVRIAFHFSLMSTANAKFANDLNSATLKSLALYYVYYSIMYGAVGSLSQPFQKLTTTNIRSRNNQTERNAQGFVTVWILLVSIAATVYNLIATVYLALSVANNSGYATFNYWRTTVYIVVPLSFLVSQIPILSSQAHAGVSELRHELKLMNSYPGPKRPISRTVESIIIFWIYYPLCYIAFIFIHSCVWWVNSYYPGSNVQLGLKITNGILAWLLEFGLIVAIMDSKVKKRILPFFARWAPSSSSTEGGNVIIESKVFETASVSVNFAS